MRIPLHAHIFYIYRKTMQEKNKKYLEIFLIPTKKAMPLAFFVSKLLILIMCSTRYDDNHIALNSIDEPILIINSS